MAGRGAGENGNNQGGFLEEAARSKAKERSVRERTTDRGPGSPSPSPTPKEAGVPALAVALSSGEVQPTAALNSAQEQVKAQAGWPQPSPQQPVLQPAFPTLPAHNKPVSSPGSSPLPLQLCAWASPGSRHPPALQTGSTSCPPIRLAGECVWGDLFNHQVFEQSRRPLRLRQEREPQWGKVDSGVLIFR